MVPTTRAAAIRGWEWKRAKGRVRLAATNHADLVVGSVAVAILLVMIVAVMNLAAPSRSRTFNWVTLCTAGGALAMLGMLVYLSGFPSFKRKRVE